MIRTFQLPPPGVPPHLKRRERTPAAESGTMGEKGPRILPKVATSTSLLGYFTCRKFTTWDRRLYFPSEGRIFFARKIRRLRPGLNPRTRVPEASTFTSRPPEPLKHYYSPEMAYCSIRYHNPFLDDIILLHLSCSFSCTKLPFLIHISVLLSYIHNGRRFLTQNAVKIILVESVEGWTEHR